MSSRGTPLATRVPRNGGGETPLFSGAPRGGRGPPHACDAPLALARRQVAAPEGAPEVGIVLACALQLHEAVHCVEPFEGVLAVEEASFVDLAEVAFDVVPGERSAAKEHRNVRQPATVHLLAVLPHDEGGFDEQAAHADGVCPVFLDGLEHFVDTYLDAEVHYFVAVVREDDVDEVLADVVHVPL